MSWTIEVDDDVYTFLKGKAEPFVDTPNSVLRRLLRLGDADTQESTEADPAAGAVDADAATSASTPSRRATTQRRTTASNRGQSRQRSGGRRSRTKVPAGSILPEREYELPLLAALVEAGGTAASRDIMNAVGRKLADRFTETDREPIESGAIRWENRIQFVRLKLVERGWMEKNVPRGTWAISDAGRNQLAERHD